MCFNNIISFLCCHANINTFPSFKCHITVFTENLCSFSSAVMRSRPPVFTFGDSAPL